MASSAGRAKRDREKARQERQALKRAKRLAGPDESEESADGAGNTGVVVAIPQDEVLARLATLHQQFEDGQIGFEDFEQAKGELLAHLDV